MIDWNTELPIIKRYAASYQIDWKLAASIRAAENGGPGREFGVLSEAAPTYEAQCAAACVSIRNAIVMDRNGAIFVGKTLPGWGAHSALSINPTWVSSFWKRWAPSNAPNDPNNLNENWYKNFMNAYFKFWEEEAAPIK